jgi:malonyl-CoA O-methyltransferase
MTAEPFRLDLRQARRAFERAARAGQDAAVLQREVEHRMLERLDYFRVRPARVLDAGCGAGRGLALLSRRFPHAELLGVDYAMAALRLAVRADSLIERVRRRLAGAARFHLCADFLSLPLRAGCVDMIWSNLALAWTDDPLSAMREFHRVLSAGGVLMFSTYGPDTLKELRDALAVDPRTRRVHSFVDMHDLGDMLVAGGFATPVMDMETITLTYADVAALARDLKASGQTCAARDRRRGLTGRDAWRRFLDAYEGRRTQGKLPATVEVVYGHAWKGEPRRTADGRQVVKMEMRTKIRG